MAIWDCKKDVLPFTAVAAAECTIVGLHTLYKAATLKGLKFFVYLAYSYGSGALLLLLISLIFSRRGLPPFNLPVLYRLILLSAIEFLARTCGYKGLEYSSPSLVSAIGALTPALTFIIAVFFRMEHWDWRSSGTQSKIIGTIASVLGSLVVVLYKGPIILSSQNEPEPSQPLNLSLLTSQANWAIGGILLVADKLLCSSSFILQVHILKMYPAPLIVSFVNCLMVAIFAVPVGFIAERKLNTWILRPDITLITVIYAALFGPAVVVSIQNLCLPLKGPLYIAIFQPFSVVLAAAASVVFLGEALHLGSVVGATILLLGFYTVLSGKAKEGKSKEHCGSDNLGASPYDENTPLLQSRRDGKYVG